MYNNHEEKDVINIELFFSVLKLVIITTVYAIICNNPSFSKKIFWHYVHEMSRIFSKAFSLNSTDAVSACACTACVFLFHSRRSCTPFSSARSRSLKVGAETPTGSCHILSFWPPPIAFFFPRNTLTCTELISRYPLYLITFATRFIIYLKNSRTILEIISYELNILFCIYFCMYFVYCNDEYLSAIYLNFMRRKNIIE